MFEDACCLFFFSADTSVSMSDTWSGAAVCLFSAMYEGIDKPPHTTKGRVETGQTLGMALRRRDWFSR